MPVATDPLIEGVYAHRLIAHAEREANGERAALARRAIDTCRRIEDDLATTITELQPVLAAAGVEVVGFEPIAGRQNHTITFLVPDPAAGEAGVAALAELGFSPWERWERGALASFRRSADQITAARTEHVTTIVRFRWRERRHRSRLDRAVTPTAGDWSIVELPRWAWWGYAFARPSRLVAERVGLRPKHHASLGPFLSTPDSLLDPLFDLVDLQSDDVLVDLGAGDGRVVLEAARRRGCRAIGVERDPDLVDAARSQVGEVDDPHVAERVGIVQGDARTNDLTDATVVFVFLPIDVVADILDDLLTRLAPGTRVLVHEQSRLPSTLMPDSSTLLLGADAVTVAHIWRVP